MVRLKLGKNTPAPQTRRWQSSKDFTPMTEVTRAGFPDGRKHPRERETAEKGEGRCDGGLPGRDKSRTKGSGGRLPAGSEEPSGFF